MNLWRAFTDHGMRPQIYESLAKECQTEREKLKVLLQRVAAERVDCIENLDAALQVLSEIGDHFMECVPEQQRAILLQMVERVIVTAEGQVRQIEWKPPFSYIQQLRDNKTGGQEKLKTVRKARTSGVSAGSLYGSLGGLGGIRTHDTGFLNLVSWVRFPPGP